MQLHYNILWVDNDIQDYIDTKSVDSIRTYLQDLGFDPSIATVEDASDLKNELFKHKYDLIISDYQLNDTTGDVIIENIRNEGLNTEILFYSAKTDFTGQQQVKDRLAFIDRLTFHYGRETLMDRIENLIALTLDKLLELNATRGLITSATSELDVAIHTLVNHLVRDVLKKSDDDLNGLIEHYVTDFLEKSPDSFRNRFKEIGFENIFTSIDANRKWKIFRTLLKEENRINTNNVLTSFLSINKTYFDQVIDIRNKFAHAKEDFMQGKQVLKGQYGKEDFHFDIDSCVEIRKNLVRHRQHFQELLEYYGLK